MNIQSVSFSASTRKLHENRCSAYVSAFEYVTVCMARVNILALMFVSMHKPAVLIESKTWRSINGVQSQFTWLVQLTEINSEIDIRLDRHLLITLNRSFPKIRSLGNCFFFIGKNTKFIVGLGLAQVLHTPSMNLLLVFPWMDFLGAVIYNHNSQIQ